MKILKYATVVIVMAMFLAFSFISFAGTLQERADIIEQQSIEDKVKSDHSSDGSVTTNEEAEIELQTDTTKKSMQASDILVYRSLNGNYTLIEEETQIGTYENPGQIDDLLMLMSENYCVAVMDVVRGTRANDWAYSANMFNDKPAIGYEYVFVHVYYHLFKESTNPVSIITSDFKAFSDGAQCDAPFIVMPDHLNEFSSGTVLPDGNKDGWIAFMVKTNKEVLISYGTWGHPERYISIGNYSTRGNTF